MSQQDWSVKVVETISGRIVEEVPFTDTPAFDNKLNDPGSGSINVPLGGNGVSKTFVDQLLTPWRFSLAICWKNEVLQAGPIVGENYSDGSSTTSISFVGMQGLFSKRLVVPSTWSSGSPATTAADVIYTSLTLRQIAKRLIQDSVSRPGGSLPLTLPADDAAGTSTRTYYGYDLNKVQDMLVNLTGVDQGPEIFFNPAFSSTTGYITWNVQIGSPRIGQTGGTPWVWDYGDRGALARLDFARDGSRQAPNWYAKASGNNYNTLIGTCADTGPTTAGFPLLEDVDTNHTDVVLQATADGYALADSNTFKYPLNSYAANVKLDGSGPNGQKASPDITEFQVGDTALFHVENHRRIPDGDYTFRIIEVSSNDLFTVKLGLQPISYM